jgi:hypothetical protein
MTTKTTLQALLIGALLAASSAFADSAIQVTSSNGRQEAKFSLGDSKCVLAGEVIVCTPVLIASN